MTDVERFLHLLRTQIQDCSLELDRYRFQFLYDASEVLDASLGYLAFCPPSPKLRKRYSQDKSLVASLASAGWLGPMRMLQPHQLEFLRKARQCLYRAAESNTVEDLEDFIASACEVHEIPEISSPEFNAASIENPQLFKHIFQLVQMIRAGVEARDYAFMKKGNVILGPQDYDWEAELNSKRCRDIAFELMNERRVENRSLLTDNAYRDALCVLYLLDHCRRFNNGEVRTITRLFTPDKAYIRSCERLGILDKLFYRPVGEKFSPICALETDTGYYLFKAMLIPPTPARMDRVEYLSDRQQTLEKLEKTISQSVGDWKQEISRLFSEDAELSEIVTQNIDELEQLVFCLYIWNDFRKLGKVSDIIKQYVEVVRFGTTLDQVGGEEFKRRLKEKEMWFEGLQSKIRVLGKIERSIEAIREVNDTAPWNKEALLVHLIQFSLSEEVLQFAQSFIDQLITDDDSSIRCLDDEIRSILNGLPNDFDPINLDVFYMYCLLLWMGGQWYDLHAEINPYLHRLGGRQEVEEKLVGLRVLWLDAKFKTDGLVSGDSRAGSALQKLRDVYERCNEPEKKGRYAISLAFSLFRSSRRNLIMAMRNKTETDSALLEAIELVRHARENLIAPETPEWIYALNQYVYYSLFANPKPDDIHIMAENLSGFRGSGALWSHRYDDTLSRYNASLVYEKHASSELAMSLARGYLDAVPKGPRSADLESFLMFALYS